jgi:hypothetical protein
MSSEKIPSETPEIPKPTFRDIELYGGFKEALRDNPTVHQAHIAERKEWAELGTPVFCTTEIIGEACHIDYSIDGEYVASIEFATEEQVTLRVFPTGDVFEMPLDEAIAHVKGRGYLQKSA